MHEKVLFNTNGKMSTSATCTIFESSSGTSATSATYCLGPVRIGARTLALTEPAFHKSTFLFIRNYATEAIEVQPTLSP